MVQRVEESCISGQEANFRELSRVNPEDESFTKWLATVPLTMLSRKMVCIFII